MAATRCMHPIEISVMTFHRQAKSTLGCILTGITHPWTGHRSCMLNRSRSLRLNTLPIIIPSGHSLSSTRAVGIPLLNNTKVQISLLIKASSQMCWILNMRHPSMMQSVAVIIYSLRFLPVICIQFVFKILLCHFPFCVLTP